MTTNLYYIRNVGCDDETVGLVRMTDEELGFLKNLVENLNKNSTYGCMPTIYVYKIDEDMIREATVDEHKFYRERIMYLEGKEYALKNCVCTWSDEFLERMVIG